MRRLADRHWELFGEQAVTALSPQGRFSDGSRLLTGTVLRATEAYGKHLLHHYDAMTLHVHLGLYGKFIDGSLPAPPPAGQIRLRLTGEHSWLDLRAPNTCELLDEVQVKSLRNRLGADPLRGDADPDRAYQRIRRSDAPLATLLLDQSIVAGAGLIFVLEILYRAGLSPTAPGRSLTPQEWQRIWDDLTELMSAAVVTGTIDTVRDEHMPQASGRMPRVDPHGGEVYVYRRTDQPCLVCGATVLRGQLAGRNSYWCPNCQR